MRTLALVSLLTLSLPAAAGTSLDAYDAHAGQVTVSDVSTLPLSRVGTDLRSFVRVKVSDTREALFAVALEDPTISVSADLAKELKLKVKSGNRRLLNFKGKDNKFKMGGEVKHAVLPTLGIGGAALKDVAVVVGDLGKVEGLPIEGILGLSTFRDTLAWAVLPSQGVLEVAPAAQGGALVSAIGEALPYQIFPRERVKGKVRKYKLDALTDLYPLVIAGSIGGATTSVSLATLRQSCMIAASVSLPGAPVMPSGDQPKAWTAVTLPGLDARDTWWARDGGLDMALVPHPVAAITCADAMEDVDVAIDPIGHTVALKRTADVKRADAQADLLQAAVKKASGEGAPTPEPDKKTKADATPAKKDPAPLKALASAQVGAGDYAGAMASWQAVLGIDDKPCDAWQGLGEAQLLADHAADAATSFKKASDLFHTWWDQPVKERDRLSKKYGKLKTDAEKDAFGHTPQPSACFTADGQLAGAWLALGDVPKVREVFASRLDLDPNVALAEGLAALVAHDSAGAPGPLRAALSREAIGSPEALPRLALAVANAQAGNWAAAEPLFKRALEIDDQDPMAVHLYLDALGVAQGSAAALAAATAWADARPDSLAALVGLLREAQLARDTRARDAATLRIEKLRTRPVWRGNIANQDALIARYLELVGRADEAQKTAEEALSRDPANPLAALVLSDLAAAKGDSKSADEWLARAARLGAMHPAYAILLGQLAPPPQGG